MISSATIRAKLSTFVHPEGGWGYAIGQSPHLEPTCLALLALLAESQKYQPFIEGACRFLEKNRFKDGSYRLMRGRHQAFWPTSLVLFTRLALGHPVAELQKTIDRLLEVQGSVIKDDPEVAEMFDIDYKKVGWPWGLNTFSWVEPTSWACLALRLAGQGNSPRVLEGIGLLLDRAFDQGGANYGNKVILGKPTEPIPSPTALMLLALQGYGDEPRIAASRSYLLAAVEKTGDLEHLGWAALALAAHDDSADLSAAIQRSYQAQTADQRPMSVVRHALAALALDLPERNPFRLPPEQRTTYSLSQNGTVLGPAKSEKEPGAGIFGWVSSQFRGIMLRGIEATRQPPTFGAVHIAEAGAYDLDLAAILRGQFDHFRPHLSLMGKRVVLKPNLVEYHRNKVINTDPRVVDAVIQLCKAEGASEIIVAEGPGHWRNVEFLVQESGLGEVLEKHQVRFVDLNHDEPVKMLNLGRCTGLEYLYLTRTVTSADVFISLPKLKTHHWAGATLSLKNLFGTLPGICYGWPKNELHWRGIPHSIVDIALTQTTHLAIVDGITGMEGDGPLNGTARHMGVLIMGIDLVAVDATCCRLMGLPAERVPTLALGAKLKLGRIAETDIAQLGEPIQKLAQVFELPPKIDKMLVPVG